MTINPEFIDLEPQPDDSDDDNDQSQTRSRGRPPISADRQIQERTDDVNILKECLPDLRLNQLTGKMEYGPRTSPTVMEGDDIDTMSVRLALEFNKFVPEQRVRAAIRYIAKHNSYCPIRRYLMDCAYSAKPYENWDRLGEILLGNPTELATKTLQKFLIGAVARAYNPGCSMSWIPIFIGAQGCGKSQLLRELVPEELFAEISVSMDLLSKEIYRLHVSYLVELPEVDNYFSVKNIENFKNLITTRVDETRYPYQSLPVSLARRFVMAGTSNRSEFLVDSTGNRRFMPLEIGDGFETPWRVLHEFRDRLWKKAIMEYEAGTQWEITSGEVAQLADYIQQFSVSDPWETIVEQYLASKDEVSANDILISALGFSPQSVGVRESKRVGSIMSALGWRRLATSRNGKSVRLWKRKTPLMRKAQSLEDF